MSEQTEDTRCPSCGGLRAKRGVYRDCADAGLEKKP